MNCVPFTHFHPESHRFLILPGNILRLEKSQEKLKLHNKMRIEFSREEEKNRYY